MGEVGKAGFQQGMMVEGRGRKAHPVHSSRSRSRTKEIAAVSMVCTRGCKRCRIRKSKKLSSRRALYLVKFLQNLVS